MAWPAVQSCCGPRLDSSVPQMSYVRNESKSCLRCKQIKPMDAFAFALRADGRRQSYCRACISEASKTRVPKPLPSDMTTKACTGCGIEKSVTEFAIDRSGRYGLSARCKKCLNARSRAYAKVYVTPDVRRRRELKRFYGLTPEDVDAMRTEQGGLCAICARMLARPVIDHCHASGRVRGMLCVSCNTRLNAIEDSEFFIKALSYLSAHMTPPSWLNTKMKECS